MQYFYLFFSLLLNVGRNTWGIIHKPYATYRKLVEDDPLQLVYILALISIYFFLVSPLKIRSFHPFLLTINASRLMTATLSAYILICFFFYAAGKIMNRTVQLGPILLSWGYSLIPTLVWFLVTSVFYVILPPPRQETLPGRLFSLMFLTFSLSLFLWKGLLYYLTLRFALRFDLLRIIIVSFVFFPLLTLYSWWMYQLGIFSIPFV